MATAKLFKLGNSQAVRIPAKYRMNTQEVEIFQRGEELVLRPKRRTAGEAFAAIRARGTDWSDMKRPPQGEMPPAPSFDD